MATWRATSESNNQTSYGNKTMHAPQNLNKWVEQRIVPGGFCGLPGSHNPLESGKRVSSLLLAQTFSQRLNKSSQKLLKYYMVT